MALPTPKLDGRTFQNLVDEAKRLIPTYCPGWTDHNVSDPGITLIELFAYMTEQYLYRLNQVPDKNYIAFLNLLGTRLEPPQAAAGSVTFVLTSSPGPQQTFVIKAGTEVAKQHTGITEAVVYWTARDVDVLPAKLQGILNTNNKAGDDWTDQSKAVEVDGSGNTQFEAWPTNPPTVNQAFVLGFQNDLSAHTVVVEFTCAPNAPGIADATPATRWQWEAYQQATGKEAAWVHLEAELDETQGLLQSGKVRLYLPDGCQPLVLGGKSAQTWLRCSPVEDKSYTTSPTLKAVHAKTWGITIPVTNRQTIGPEILGASNGQPSQSFSLAFGPCLEPASLHSSDAHDEDQAEWVVDVQNEQRAWEPWTRVDHFGDSSEADPHYRIDAGVGIVEFGPKVLQPPKPQLLQRDGQSTKRPLQERQFGRIPLQGRQIRIRRYRIGGGRQGNAGPGEVNVLRQGIQYIASVANRAPITGGKDAQTLEEAKLQAPARLRTRDRAVTAEDFEYWVQQVPGVGRVHCVRPEAVTKQSELTAEAPPEPGAVKLLIIPGLTYFDEANLEKYIDARRKAPRSQMSEEFALQFMMSGALEQRKMIEKLFTTSEALRQNKTMEEFDQEFATSEALRQNKTMEEFDQEFMMSEALKQRIDKFLSPHLLLTTVLQIDHPTYIGVRLGIDVKIAPRANRERVKQDLEYALYRWLHPLYGGDERKGWPLGRPVTIDRIYAIVNNIAGVEYAIEAKLYVFENGRWVEPKTVSGRPSNDIIVIPPLAVVNSGIHLIAIKN